MKQKFKDGDVVVLMEFFRDENPVHWIEEGEIGVITVDSQGKMSLSMRCFCGSLYWSYYIAQEMKLKKIGVL